MVEGADIMLDKVSVNTDECYLDMSDEPFEGADEITLVGDLTYSIGGGDYIMPNYKGEVINHKMWLCAVTVDVFDTLPSMIYVGYPTGEDKQHTPKIFLPQKRGLCRGLPEDFKL